MFGLVDFNVVVDLNVAVDLYAVVDRFGITLSVALGGVIICSGFCFEILKKQLVCQILNNFFTLKIKNFIVSK